jgi:hypothetical protein
MNLPTNNSTLLPVINNMGSLLKLKKASKDIDQLFQTHRAVFYKSDIDFLTISALLYKLSITDTSLVKHNSILDKGLVGSVNDEDHELAKNIRDYYSKKIMLAKLKEIPLTKFADDLSAFIHTDGLNADEKTLGMISCLPRFYFYDKQLDEISLGKNLNCTHKQHENNFSLTFVSSTMKTTKAFKNKEYWLTDEKNRLVRISVDVNNPLISIWEKTLQNKIVNFSAGTFFPRRFMISDKNYLDLQKFTVM